MQAFSTHPVYSSRILNGYLTAIRMTLGAGRSKAMKFARITVNPQ